MGDFGFASGIFSAETGDFHCDADSASGADGISSVRCEMGRIADSAFDFVDYYWDDGMRVEVV